VALVIPAVDELDLRWQAESQYCFVMPAATGMTGTSGGVLRRKGILLTLARPKRPLPTLTPAVREESAQEIRALDIKEIIVAPQSPAVPNWSWHQQAEAVAWVDRLVGEAPEQGPGVYPAYFWKALPSAGDIAAGTVPGGPAA